MLVDSGKISLVMDAPPIRYMRTSDGTNIAYTVCGEGRPMVMLGPALFHNVRTLWNQYPDWMEGLAGRFQLICYDQRGWGHSSRGLPADLTEDRLDADLSELIDHLHLAKLAFFAAAHPGHRAVRYAARYPDRVEALIWTIAHVNMSAWPSSLFYDLSEQNWEMFLSSLVRPGLSLEEHQRWLNEFRDNINLEDYRRIMAIAHDSDVEPELQRVKAPSLLFFPKNYRAMSPQEGMKVASLIPESRFVLVDGTAMLDNPEQGLAAVDSFMAELPAPVAGRNAAALSSREREVLGLLAVGKSNQQIAEELVLSLNTVKRHVSNIFVKTGVTSRAQAILYAQEHGLS